jgi:hypothetical protein
MQYSGVNFLFLQEKVNNNSHSKKNSAMAGTNDRIHGYNAIYRADPANFNSFALSATGRPGNFIFRQVEIAAGGGGAINDHQGHIIPQNILNTVLDDVMADMAQHCDTPDEVTTYITNNTEAHPWLATTRAYGTAIGAPMFDFDSQDPEDKMGGFFSLITWNPVNICRAPSDNARMHNNLPYPGDAIDEEVYNYLVAHQEEEGISEAWLAALTALVADPEGEGLAEAYITACSATLAGQQAAGAGYYAFPWVNNNGVYSPQVENVSLAQK